jgi:hypothetical protein
MDARFRGHVIDPDSTRIRRALEPIGIDQNQSLRHGRA